MKKITVIIFLIYIVIPSYAQKYDNTWVIGYVHDANNNDLYRKNIITFSKNKIKSITDVTSVKSKMSSYNLTASDSIGNLAFYFNGLQIYNRDHKLMTNGDSIGYFINGKQWENHISFAGCLFEDDVNLLNYTQKFVPYPGYKNQYLLFFTYFDTVRFGVSGSNVLSYVRIDMNLSDNMGTVIEKDNKLIDSYMEGMGFVKHANGVDWWLVTSPVMSNIFYVYLITSNGILGPKKQIVGPEIATSPVVGGGGHFTNTSSKFDLFSPDGKLFAKIESGNGIFLYDFDRCNGALSFNRKISDIPYTQRIAFSPNSKYFYFYSIGNIYQYNLDSSTENNDYNIVGTLPRSVFLQLAPDNNIYFSYDRSKNMGYINRPNQSGITCDVKPIAIQTPYEKATVLPQFPNYRLEAIDDANCGELDSVFTPIGLPVKYKVENKEYIRSGRFEMIRDTSWMDLYK